MRRSEEQEVALHFAFKASTLRVVRQTGVEVWL